MHVEHHDLSHEFPEFKEEIHRLKLEDGHFRRLFQEYGELDKEICRIEEDIELTSEQELEALKKKRVHLKDTLYGLLQAAKA